MKDNSSFKKVITQSTVKVTADGSVGTGFFVSKEGYLMSAWHVVNELTNNIEIELYNGTKLKGSLDIQKSDRIADISVIKVDLEKNKIDCLPISLISNASLGDDIATFGYAGDSLEYINGGYFEGKISNIDEKRIYIDNLVKGKGNSGAPVVHLKEKKVIGVISSLTPKNISHGTGHAKHIKSILTKWTELTNITKTIAKELEKKLDYIPKYITNISGVDNYELIGRKQELKLMDERLDISNFLLINGIGGIGKTILLKSFLHKFKDKFEHIIWIDITSTTMNAFTENSLLISNLNINFLKDENKIVKFETILNKLTTITGNNLLVIDNAIDDNIYKSLKPLFSNWNVIITSREKLNGLSKGDKILKLEELEKDDAKKLFLKYYTEDDIDDNRLENLLDLIGYHTLTIELMAKMLELDFTQDIEGLENFLKNSSLSDDDLQIFVSTSYTESEQGIYKHLLNIFKLVDLDDNQKEILLYFSILPSVDIHGKDLIKYFQIEDKNTFINTLNSLVKLGWLQSKSKGYFRLHKIIQDIIRFKLTPNSINCKALIESFRDLLLVKTGKNPLEKSNLIPFGDSISLFIKDETQLMANFFDNFAKILRYFGYNKKALKHALKALNIREKELSTQDNSFGNSYLNISVIYRYLLEYKKSLEYGNRALKFYLDKRDYVGIATAYYKLTLTYVQLEEFEKALSLNNKDIRALSKGVNKGHAYFAESFNIRGEIYRHLKKYYKSIRWKRKSIEIRENVLDDKHPDLAKSYHDMALSYVDIGDIFNANIFIDKSMKIREKILPFEHDDLIESNKLKLEILNLKN